MESLADIYLFTAALLCWAVTPIRNQSGICQVYSYNIRVGSSSPGERHYFVCCGNTDEHSCLATTYQKPSRHESFCSGDRIEKGGNHFTQMETSAYPGQGRFYCGGCCGQHLAATACDTQITLPLYQQCNNWVQCFMKECRKVVAEVRDHEQLDCVLPPAPHPKHFRPEPRTLPANLSQQLSPTASPPPLSPIGGASNRTKFSCTPEECNALDKPTRCRLVCCQESCCLTDGELSPEDERIWFGFSTIQMIGISIGVLTLIVAVAGLGVLFVRRCHPICRPLKAPANDTQVLVIEGPEEPDSDQDDDSS